MALTPEEIQSLQNVYRAIRLLHDNATAARDEVERHTVSVEMLNLQKAKGATV